MYSISTFDVDSSLSVVMLPAVSEAQSKYGLYSSAKDIEHHRGCENARHSRTNENADTVL